VRLPSIKPGIRTASLAYSGESFEQTLGIGDGQGANRAIADIGGGFSADDILPGCRVVDGKRRPWPDG